MTLPDKGLLAGLPTVPFIASISTFLFILLISLVVVVCYVYRFGHEAQPGRTPRVVSVLSCVTVLGSVLLLPVDVFLTSYQKYSNGTWKDWALDNTTRADIGDGILYTYYTCYSLLILFLFLLIPFAYFYFEEGDEEDIPPAARSCTAIKYTLCFGILILAMLMCGAFIQFGEVPNNNGTVIDEFKFLGDQIKSKGVESALSFTTSVLSVCGLLSLTFYTAYGLSAFPFDFVKTRGNARGDLVRLNEQQIVRNEKERQLRAKYADGRPMIPADRRLLRNIERDNERYGELTELVERQQRSCWGRVKLCFRPFTMLLGIFLTLVSLLFMSSLTVTVVDKFVNSNYTLGYVLPTIHYPNPLNIVLTYAQRIFPLDYVLLLLIVFYIAVCTVDGIRRIGIWFLWIRMFDVQPKRTMPQGLLCLSAVFITSMTALNQLILVTVPTYATYGNQHYQRVNGTVEPCSSKAPPDECQFTQLASLITRFTLNANFFGAVLTYLMCAFIAVYVIGFVVALVRRKRNILEKLAADQEDDPLLNL